MSLLERYRANLCAHVDCDEPRCPDAALCGRHLVDLRRNLLDRLDDGTFIPRRRFAPRDLTGRIVSHAA